jgi:curli biogenesis system outer membrane secretion channel CsgG
MADQLTDALMKSGKFVVVERQLLQDVIGEQDLAASGRAAASQAAQTGKIVPAQILIKGTVTEFEEVSGSSGTGISYRGISLGSSKSTAHVAVILRLIDTTSGQVLDSVRVEGDAKSGGLSIGVSRSVDFNTSGFKATPLGKAVQIVIDRAVVKITKGLKGVPFSGKVIKVDGETIYTNIGARNGGASGQVYRVYAPGEELIDYDTGEVLGSEDTLAGEIELTSVQEKFSKAVARSGSVFERGYIVNE